MPSSARRPGRGRQPVEHRLDLVGGRVAGGRHAAAARDERRGLGVARVARPGLQVVRAGRPARAVDVQLDAERVAQRGAVRLVAGRAVAQPVVAVQRGDVPGPGEADGDVEQAHRVPPAREQHEHRLPGRQQPAGPDAREQVGHADDASRRPRRSKAAGSLCGPAAWRAMRPAASAGGVRVRDASRRTTAPHLRPIAWFGWRQGLALGPRSCQSSRAGIRPRGADTPPRASSGTARTPAW